MSDMRAFCTSGFARRPERLLRDLGLVLSITAVAFVLVEGFAAPSTAFAADTRTLTYAAGANGSIAGSATQVVDYGSDGTSVTATPDAGHHFTSWSDGLLSATRTDTGVTADKSVTAAFAIDWHSLVYSAGPGGSVVGTGTQDGTELEGFESIGQWYEDVLGHQSADTSHVKHGSASLRLTASPGVPACSYKEVSLDLSSAAPLRLWFYVAEDPRVAKPGIQLAFFTADWKSMLYADIEPEAMVQGWNCVSLARSDFTSVGGASWSDTFKYVQVLLSPTGTSCNVSFDSLRVRVPGVPMVALTFDDAMQTQYDQAFTYMSSKGLAGTAYVVPSWIDEPDRLTLSECATMNAAGWDIANHTWDHPWSNPDLTQLTPSQVRAEFTDARDWLLSKGFTRAAADVAYPSGSYNATVCAAMAATGMRSGRTTFVADNPLPLADPYQLRCYFPATLAQAKADVDQAVSRQSLVVLGFHDLVPTVTNGSQYSISDFRALVDYIATQTVTAVRMSDVMGGKNMQAVDYGSNGTTVTAVPDVGHHFTGWSDGVLSATRAETGVIADKSVTALFAIDTHTVTPTAGANGTITPGGVQTVDYGSSATFAVATNTVGYHIADVLIDGESVGASSSVTLQDVTTNHTIAATFAIDTHTITPTAGANGTITPGGVRTVDYGGSATFAVTPAIGYHVATLIVDGTPVTATTTCTFANVTVDHTVAATFAINTYTITPAAGAHGTITPSTAQIVGHGSDSATFVIATNTVGYHIADVLIDGESVGASSSVTLQDVTTNHTIAATFAIDTHTITPTAGANGTITPGGAQTIDYGSGATFTVTPAADYHLATLKIDGASVTATTTYAFTNVTADRTISVTFAANPLGVWSPARMAGMSGSAVTIDYGQSVALSAALTDGSGMRVTGTVPRLQSSTNGVTFSDAGATSESAGAHCATIAPEVRTYYRFSFAGNRELAASHSSAIVVTPRVPLWTPTCVSSVPHAKWFTVRSMLRLAYASSPQKIKFVVKRWSHGTWRSYSSKWAVRAKKGSYSSYAASLKAAAGKYQICAYASGSSSYAATTSGYRKVVVK